MGKDKGENYPAIYGKPVYNNWEEDKSYTQFDRVNYKGAVYAAKVGNTGVNPFFDDGETWQLIDGYSFESGDTLEVETTNGTLISGRKVNTSQGVTHSINASGINISGVKASKDNYGVVKAGEGVNVEDGVISAIPPKVATIENVGIVKPDGDTITIDEDGTLIATPEVYELPTASSTVKGGVKVGSGLTINNEVLDTNITFSEGVLYIN